MGTRNIDSKAGQRVWLGGVLLAGLAGTLLTLGCDSGNVSAGELQTASLDNGKIEREVADLEQQLADADHGAQREIDQARVNAQKMPVASRERIADAIERTEQARDEAGDRLAELKESGARHWDARRARVVEALGELDEARHDVVAALAGGQPSLSDG